MASQTPDVLVLGGGFAGVVAARELRAAVDRALELRSVPT
jgi:cation diffusion facilitator CzcD-associated flavoprotein CzcO